MTSLSWVTHHQNAVYNLHYRQQDISLSEFYFVMWDNWGWFRGLWTNSWWCASPQYAIQQISKGWRKQTKTKSFSDKRTSKHSLVSEDSHIKMLYKIKILPAAQHCTETKDVTVFRQAWHMFWSVSFTKDGQQSTLNTTSSRVLQI